LKFNVPTFVVNDKKHSQNQLFHASVQKKNSRNRTTNVMMEKETSVVIVHKQDWIVHNVLQAQGDYVKQMRCVNNWLMF